MSHSIDFSSPQVVAPVCNQADLDFLSTAQISDHCDILELRLDDLSDHAELLDQVETMLTKHRPALPILATARHPDEGGSHALSSSERQQLYLRFLPLVDALDIELRSIADLSAVIEAARSSKKTLVMSFHDFENTPTTSLIRKKIDQAIEAQADVCKVAFFLNSPTALDELKQICEKESRIKVSMMGMGPLGKNSRPEFAKAGSVLNYGYLQTPNAPGQWPAEQLKKLISEI